MREDEGCGRRGGLVVDYDGCLVWPVTVMRVVFSPETGEHKAVIGRQAADRYNVQSGCLGENKRSGREGEYGLRLL